MRIRNYARNHERLVFGRACEVLSAFSQWRTIDEAVPYCRGITRGEIEQYVATLRDAGFLAAAHDEPGAADAAMETFEPWNPAAGFFHSATRNVAFSSLNDLRREQREKSRERPWPGATHVPESGEIVALPVSEDQSPLTAILTQRRSWRQFGDDALPLEALATLLWLTGGIQHWVVTDLGTFALKTSPSGGSLHPIELYVLVRSVAGLRPGFYHYAAGDHQLRLLAGHAAPRPVTTYLPSQPWFEGANAVTFFVAHYERSLWRYSYPRAYRAPLVEAGHLAQTFCLSATELGLAPFVSMALADDPIEREIGADGITRAVLYAAGVGVRPANVESAPVPAGFTAPRVEPNRPRR
jgi:SagB-type dehydrogenase family enzyme